MKTPTDPPRRPRSAAFAAAALTAAACVPHADAAPPAPAERPTARRTLRTDGGELLRGTKLVVGKKLPGPTAFALDPASWREVRSLGLNTVRLCWVDPWYRARGYDHWTVAEALPKLDSAVAAAKATGATVILNYQSVGEFQNGNRDFAPLRAFWEAAAPRYADEPHVIYEIVNEPAFDQAVYFDPAFREPLLEVYRQVRRDAPGRDVLMFSFNSVDHELTRIVDAYAHELDWEKTTVAFHLYGGGATTESVRTLLGRYPAACTELDYPGTHPYVNELDGRALSVRNCEDLGVSWVDWSDWGHTSFTKIREVLIPDAKAKGYWWGRGGGPDRGRTPPPVLDFSGRRTVTAAAGGDLAAGGAGGGGWVFTKLGDGRYRLAPADRPGVGLTGGEEPGDGVSLTAPNDGWLSQRWRVEPVWAADGGGDADGGFVLGSVRLRCEWTDLPLAAGGADGGPAMAERDADGPAVRWTLDPAPSVGAGR